MRSVRIWVVAVLIGLAFGSTSGLALSDRATLASQPEGVSALPWAEVVKLVSTNAQEQDLFGTSIAMSLDTVVVGAPGTDSGMGSAYIFERNWWLIADHWGQVIALGAGDPWTGERFGESVAIDGDTVVVGAPFDGGGVGAAYVFYRNRGIAPDSWGQLVKLTAVGGAVGDHFGTAVAISGNVVAVGAPGNEMVYLYERNQDGQDAWGELARLTANDGAPGDAFGSVVAASGSTVLVGGHRVASQRGAAYVFERNEGGPDNWEQVAKLVAADGGASDLFGISVAIDGDTAVVGALGDNNATGAAYVFARNEDGADAWGQVGKLVAADAVADGEFGASVALDDDVVVVGALEEASGRQARAYLFERNRGGTDAWGPIATLVPGDGWQSDLFGTAVAVSGDTAAAGAAFAQTTPGYTGAAYLFRRQSGRWLAHPKLTATQGSDWDEFGWAVAVDGDTAVIGAWFDNGGGASTGAAYVFKRNQGGADRWGQVARLVASDGVAGDEFGQAVAIDNDTIIVGARKHDAAGTDAGAAYVFERNQGGADHWGQVDKLLSSSPAAEDRFGGAVAISADRILVGEPYNDTSCTGGATDCGIVHIYERNQGGPDHWGWSNALLPWDGLASTALFGASVSLDGERALVGAPGDDTAGTDSGAAWVFERNQGGAEQWWDVAALIAGDLVSGDAFGTAVALSGDTAVVGAPKKDGTGSDSGAVYLFQRNYDEMDAWGRRAKLAADDAAAQDRLGLPVGIDNNLVVVGAIGVDGGGGDEAGAVYLFERNQGGVDAWGQMDRLIPADTAPGRWFGRSLSIGGGTIAIGCPYDGAAKSGSAYLFRVGPYATYLPLVRK